ncbi:MAG: hypothetical protein AAF244_05380 [Pseudomonadota bacterium]
MRHMVTSFFAAAGVLVGVGAAAADTDMQFLEQRYGNKGDVIETFSDDTAPDFDSRIQSPISHTLTDIANGEVVRRSTSSGEFSVRVRPSRNGVDVEAEFTF